MSLFPDFFIPLSVRHFYRTDFFHVISISDAKAMLPFFPDTESISLIVQINYKIM